MPSLDLNHYYKKNSAYIFQIISFKFQIQSVPSSAAVNEPESAPINRKSLPVLRAIFPDFSKTGLRSNAEFEYLRPDQVKPLPEKFLSSNIISFKK